ncbi:MAG: hypothetical protein HQL13_04270 [Candidatus Omnitrophica bacterium]|nr:hypothetical protein [Candidatus Omnitrophota bacterium]
MKKLFYLIILFFIWIFPLHAQEMAGEDKDFIKSLDNLKDPFGDGYPKPPEIKLNPVIPKPQKPEVVVFRPKPVLPPKPVERAFPAMRLQGVIVGEGIQEAIIDDQVAHVGSSIQGAIVDEVNRDGVRFLFDGKRKFLKVD